MNSFDIPIYKKKLSTINFFEINLLSSEIFEKTLDENETDIFYKTDWEAPLNELMPHEEGLLRIPVCRLEDGKCFLHICGKLKGKEITSSGKIGNYSPKEFAILNQRIKFVLNSSKNTLRRYYIESDLNRMKNHLAAFLFVF